MRVFEILKNQRIVYLMVYFLILLHFAGGLISHIAILISSILIFLYVAFSPKLDLYLIFLLIIPSIIFKTDSTTFNKANFLLKNFNNVWILGPVALSSSLMMVMAVPVRLLIYFRSIKYKFLAILWFFTLILAIVGLFLAVLNGEKNPSGLTVGLRIALTIGTVLIGQSVKNKENFIESIDKIILVSLIILMTGIISAHWYFIVFGFIPFALFRIKPKILLLIPAIYVLFVIIHFDNATLTILGILLLSLIFFLLINWGEIVRTVLRTRFFIFLIIIIPLVLTIYTLSLESIKTYDITTLGGYIEFKLLADRKPIWDATWKDISSSFFLLKPAGGHLLVYFEFTKYWMDWPAGSHNIFLEIGRQIGTFSMISLSFILLFILYKSGKVIRSKDDMILYYCFLSIYLIFGLTGQSIIYDGVGALFWLLLGQMYHVFRDSNKNEDVLTA